jgi:hypothetical protein
MDTVMTTCSYTVNTDTNHYKCSRKSSVFIQNQHFCKQHGKMIEQKIQKYSDTLPICTIANHWYALSNRQKLPCGHVFCYDCLVKRARQDCNAFCPMCDEMFDPWLHIYGYNDMLSEIMEGLQSSD